MATNNSFPNCLIIPSVSGATTNCLNIKLPSVSTIALLIIVYWIIYLIVAYLLFWFLNKMYPNQKINYWIILLILVVSGFIIALLSRL